MEALAALLRISLAVKSRNLAFNTTEKGFPIYENLNQIWKKMGNDMSDKLISSIKEAFTLSSLTTTAQHKSIATEEKLTAPFNFPHFLDLMGKHMKPTTFDRQLCDTFKVLDKDSTGFVFVSELRHILTSINKKLEPSEFASRSGRSMSGPVPSEKRNGGDGGASGNVVVLVVEVMVDVEVLEEVVVVVVVMVVAVVMVEVVEEVVVEDEEEEDVVVVVVVMVVEAMMVVVVELQLFFYPFAKLFFDALSFH
ncbi:hypothetical protein L3X38_008625 [Prunus dulcis]|uniref:EF-hand domain-containing protein n=1 Tax=Prunus dulcis TaxID=3755 RepID=A0AAD5F7B3_PRUDU|nr:hypothetical protein L3X38_008625 [Prunus dulcis]